MKTTDIPPSSRMLAKANADAMAHYKKLRDSVMPPPGVEPATAETMLTMQFAVLGLEVPFKIHAMRAIDLGLTREQLPALVMAGLGVTLLSAQAGQALRWLDEVCEERGGAETGAV